MQQHQQQRQQWTMLQRRQRSRKKRSRVKRFATARVWCASSGTSSRPSALQNVHRCDCVGKRKVNQTHNEAKVSMLSTWMRLLWLLCEPWLTKSIADSIRCVWR